MKTEIESLKYCILGNRIELEITLKEIKFPYQQPYIEMTEPLSFYVKKGLEVFKDTFPEIVIEAEIKDITYKGEPAIAVKKKRGYKIFDGFEVHHVTKI